MTRHLYILYPSCTPSQFIMLLYFKNSIKACFKMKSSRCYSQLYLTQVLPLTGLELHFFFSNLSWIFTQSNLHKHTQPIRMGPGEFSAWIRLCLCITIFCLIRHWQVLLWSSSFWVFFLQRWRCWFKSFKLRCLSWSYHSMPTPSRSQLSNALLHCNHTSWGEGFTF